MKKLFALLLAIASASAGAQFSPGQVLTAAQLNNQFALYLPFTGGTLTGTLYGPNAVFASATISGGSITGATVSGLSSPIGISDGGTGASTASTALANLGGAALSGSTFTGQIVANSSTAYPLLVNGTGTGSAPGSGMVAGWNSANGGFLQSYGAKPIYLNASGNDVLVGSNADLGYKFQVNGGSFSYGSSGTPSIASTGIYLWNNSQGGDITWISATAPTDQKFWDFLQGSNSLTLRAVSDTWSNPFSALVITRSGSAVENANIPITTASTSSTTAH